MKSGWRRDGSNFPGGPQPPARGPVPPPGAPGRGKLQDFLVDRKVGREQRDTVPLVVDGRDRIVWVVGQSVAEDFRVTDPSRGVILFESQAFRRRRLNSTLKSLLFWVVLIAVGLLIWQFSTTFQRNENQISFSIFLKHVQQGEVASVTITGNEITGVMTTSATGDGNTKFRTHAPTQ